jgi:hypothetical protein
MFSSSPSPDFPGAAQSGPAPQVRCLLFQINIILWVGQSILHLELLLSWVVFMIVVCGSRRVISGSALEDKWVFPLHDQVGFMTLMIPTRSLGCTTRAVHTWEALNICNLSVGQC